MKHRFEKIVSVLSSYRDSDFKLSATAKKNKVCKQTVRNWKLHYGGIIYGLLDNAGGDQGKVSEEEFNRLRLHKPKTETAEIIETTRTDVVHEKDMEEATYQSLITETKYDAVKALRKRIKFGTSKSISAKEITEALKLLHDIDSVGQHEGADKLSITEEYAQLLVLSYKKKSIKAIS